MRNKLIESYLNQGYTLDYILMQERAGWDAFNQGVGSGLLSDMACEFYLLASMNARTNP